jgi:hypothetical protein
MLAAPLGALAGPAGQVQDPRAERSFVLPAAPDAPAAAGDTGGAPARTTSILGSAAGADQLEGARGGTAVRVSEATLQGTVAGNSATQVVTGANVIQSGSFANMSGLPVVIQNSGANVLIQNATVINLELK